MFGTIAARSTTTASPRSTSTCASSARPRRLAVGEGCSHTSSRKTSTGTRRRPAAAGALPRRDRRDRARLPRRHRDGRGRRAARASTCARRRELVGGRAVDEAARRRRRRRCRPRVAELLDGWPQIVEAYSGDELVVQRPRPGAPHHADPRVAVGQHGSRASRSPATPRTRELLRFLRGENLPGRFPFTAGVFPLQARGRGPGPDVRRRGRRRSAPTAASSSCRRTPSHAPVDGVRLRDALRPRPRHRAPTSTARSATPACRSRRSTT